MIVKQLINTAETTDNSDPEIVCNLATDDMLICYDLTGGTSSPTIEIHIYGRMPDASATLAVGDTTTFDATEWVELYSVTGLNTGDNGAIRLSHSFPNIACYITGNARAATIRVWAAYNEMGDDAR